MCNVINLVTTWAQVLWLCHKEHILLIPHEVFNSEFWLTAGSLCGTSYGKCGGLTLVREKEVC